MSKPLNSPGYLGADYILKPRTREEKNVVIAYHATGDISYFAEEVFLELFPDFKIGEVWELDNGSFGALSHDGSFFIPGFSNKQYACEFLDRLLTIRKIDVPPCVVDLE